MLGCLLYCVTTQSLTDGLGRHGNWGNTVTTPEPVDIDFDGEVTGFPRGGDESRAIQFFPEASQKLPEGPWK